MVSPCRVKHEDPWNRIEDSEADPCILGGLDIQQEWNHHTGVEGLRVVLENWLIIWRKIKQNPYLTPPPEMSSRQIKRLREAKAIKLTYFVT